MPHKPSTPSQAVTVQAERLAYYSLVACAVIGPLGMAPQEIFAVLAIIAWVISCVSGKHLPGRTAVSVLFIAWFIIAALSLTQSTHLPTSLKGLQKLLKYFGIFYATAEVVRSRERLFVLFKAAMAGLALVAANGVIQVVSGADLFYRRAPGEAPGGLPRLMSTFPHPNDYGTYAVTVLPICVAVALSARTFKLRAAAWAAVCVAGVSLLCTFSRPSVLAIAVSMAALLVIRKAWKTAAAAALAGFLGAINLPQSVKDWAASQPSWLAVIAQPLRFEIWQAGWNMIASHPWLGIGANMFVHDYIYYRIPGDTQAASYGHNQYIQVAAEIGVFGLLVFLAVIVRTLHVWRRLLQDKEVWVRQAAQGLGCGIIAFLAIGLLESALQSSRSNVFFWIWLGALHGLALDRIKPGKV